MRLSMVWKLVSVPPSQRFVTNGMPQRPASASMDSCACFFVPTKTIVSPRDATPRAKSIACCKSGTVCWRSMMWILLRSVKM
jgi:hypothetical protein